MYLDVHVCALYVHERMCMMDVRFLRHAKKRTLELPQTQILARA
jgi:hypothetical protein